MLSILIPTFNYNVYPLVLELNKQCDSCGIDYEIIVLDDAGSLFHLENQAINNLTNCAFSSLDSNIGRSKMRNLLAQKAMYDWLLFLDADTIPLKSDFISTYLNYTSGANQIIYGGITYSKDQPPKNKALRWFYGKEREALDSHKRSLNPYISFLTLNFLIPKVFFRTVSFNENIPNLRHEDTLYSYDLSKKNIPILHITNPIVHLGLDTNEIFLEKTKQSVVALKNLVDEDLIDIDYVRLAKFASKMSFLKVDSLIAIFYQYFKKKIEKKLCSEHPSMLLFDIYRLSYYCALSQSKNKTR